MKQNYNESVGGTTKCPPRLCYIEVTRELECYRENFLNIFLLLAKNPRLFPFPSPSVSKSRVRTGLRGASSLMREARERLPDDEAGDPAREPDVGPST